MVVEKCAIKGVFLLQVDPIRSDKRGAFWKIFKASDLKSHGVSLEECQEEYFSFSVPGVFRGMHFQSPPHEHSKLVSCVSGEVLDYVLDLRRGSSSYGCHIEVPLSAEGGKSIFIPKGCAHGFAVRGSKTAILHYRVSSEHSPEHDHGLHWSSVKLPKAPEIISDRDESLPKLQDFVTPFV